MYFSNIFVIASYIPYSKNFSEKKTLANLANHNKSQSFFVMHVASYLTNILIYV